MTIKHALTSAKPDGGDASLVRPSDWNADHVETFTPADIPDLGLWLDASQLALADDDPVATWPDLSGNGYDATQATTENRPVFKAELRAGLGVVRFDASAVPKRLALSGTGLDLFRAIPGLTIAMVANNQATSGGGFLGAKSGAGFPNEHRVDWEGLSSSFQVRHDDAVGPAAAYWTGRDIWTPVIGWASLGDAIMVMAPGPQNSADDAALGGTLTSDTPSVSIMIGGDGSLSDIGGLSPVDIGELIVYQRALNARERRRVSEYLSAKWGTL